MCMLKGLPAAFASAAFGTFLDQKRRGDFSTAACQTVLRLITILSDSYIDTTKKSVLGQLQATLGSQFVGESSGHEKSMLSLVREELLHFYQQVMTPDMRFTTLEPSLTSGVSFCQSYIVCCNTCCRCDTCAFTDVLLWTGCALCVSMHPSASSA